MSEQFNTVPMPSIPRAAFDLGHERKFSMNMGDLVPILCEEVVPGDQFRLNTEVLMRLAPMASPVMHRVNCYTHFFFVPTRIIWEDWEKFITGGETGNETAVIPYVHSSRLNATNMGNGSLSDFLGIATWKTGFGTVALLNALPFRAYKTIWNEYYREQNLQVVDLVAKTSGVDGSGTLMDLKKRNWEKDYFTSALPWTQRGAVVRLPMTGDAVVKLMGPMNPQIMANSAGNPLGNIPGLVTTGSGELYAQTLNVPTWLDPNGTLLADMATVTAATIEELRRATKLQQFLERNARGGSRLIEVVWAHFKVKSSDSRLQRPEYLGGGKTPIVISEVLQTSVTTPASPQGNMAGHGVATGNSHRFSKTFEEHGYVIGIISVLPKTSYHQGTRRHFFKKDKFDYYWPEFATLGEQPVKKGELYSEFTATDDTEVFGYQSRYAEYKYIPSSVHGDFKNVDPAGGTLGIWHMSRHFTAKPALNSAFVTSNPTHRIFAVTDESTHKLWVQVYNDLQAIRPIPFHNVPQL